MPTIRVRRHQVDENTNVGYRAKHVFPELAAESIGPRRPVAVARIGGISLLIAGAAVGAVVVLSHSAQQGNAVAASSKQVPAPNVATTRSGTGSKGGAGTKKASSPAGSPASKGNARVSTRAGGRAGPSSGGSGSDPVAASPSIDPVLAASPAVDLPVPAHFGPLLRQTWARANPGGVGIKASDILSTVVGSVFYAEQPAAHTYWAISQFVPSALAESRGSTPAGVALLAEFHGTAEFEKVPGHHWTFVGSSSTGACPGALPVPVLTTWGLCTLGS
jgi:hypothetical protein